MAIADGRQAPIDTFALLVVLAAFSIAAFFTLSSRHLGGNSLRLRLVLLVFLITSALWGVMGFVATLIPGGDNSSCLVVVLVGFGFDQFARLAFELLLIFRVKSKHSSSVLFFLQSLLIIRFLVGGVLVGLQKPQLRSVCVATNTLLPIGITALAIDAFVAFVIFLFTYIYGSSNSTGVQRVSGDTSVKVVAFLTAGFAAWSATSAPMILGLQGSSVFARTVAPAVGLLMLLVLILLFRSHFKVVESATLSASTVPKAHPLRTLSNRPNNSHGSRASSEVFQRPWEDAQLNASRPSNVESVRQPVLTPGFREAESALPVINRQVPGQTARGLADALVEAKQFALFRASTAPIILQKPSTKSLKDGKLSISSPIISESSSLKMADISTVDLVTALQNDKERRALLSSNGSQSRKPPASISAPPESLKRRQVPDIVSVVEAAPPIQDRSRLRRELTRKNVLREYSGIFMDPGVPPAIPDSINDEKPLWSSSMAADSSLVQGVKSLPRHNQFQGSRGQTHKVKRAGVPTTKSRDKPAFSPTTTEFPGLSSTGSIIHRPRPIPRKTFIYKAKCRIKVSQSIYQHRVSRQDSSVDLGRESFDWDESDSKERLSQIPFFPQPPKSAGALLTRIEDGQFTNPLPLGKRISSRGFEEALSPTTSLFDDDDDDDDNNNNNTALVGIAGNDSKTAFSSFRNFNGSKSVSFEISYAPVLPGGDLRLVALANVDPSTSEAKKVMPVPSSAKSNSSTASLSDDGTKEIVPLILDAESRDVYSCMSSRSGSETQPTGWHRRIDEACPSFSNRKNGNQFPRQIVAVPAALLLSNLSKPVKSLETSASPQQALDVIRQQLELLDEADSEATGIRDGQGSRLLASLEAEMGLQESHWQDIRRNLSADGVSFSVRCSMSFLSGGEVHNASLQSSPTALLHDASLTDLTKAGLAGGSVDKRKMLADERMAAPQGNVVECTRGGGGGRAEDGEAQQQTKEVLFSDVSSLGSKARVEKHESEREIAAGHDARSDLIGLSPSNLVARPETVHPVSRRWSIDSDTTTTVASQASGAVSEPRFAQESLSQGKLSRERDYYRAPLPEFNRENLLFSTAADSKSNPARPNTQKPSRRGKRITVLPDIPESPKPLENKDSALGIFQFPWGETSDIATLQPQPSARFSVPSSQVKLNQVGVAQAFLPVHGSSVLPCENYSLFDFYDDEDEDDEDQVLAPDSDGSTGGYSDEDDDDDEEEEEFDETTLWEIANLLHSDEIPSRDSLFPRTEDYCQPSPRDGFVSEDETTILTIRNIATADFNETTLGAKYETLPRQTNSARLWKASIMPHTTSRHFGLAQPDDRSWKGYLSAQAEAGTLRAALRMSEPDTISSTSLCTAPMQTTRAEEEERMRANELWQPVKENLTSAISSVPSSKSVYSATETVEKVAAPSADGTLTDALWSKPAPLPAEQTAGLWSTLHMRHVYKTTEKQPAAVDRVFKLRIDHRPLATLHSHSHSASSSSSSSSLWSTTTKTMSQVSRD